ncbi:MAG: 5'-deoxyadenosine deaminase [Myxococcales bacterium]|nr:5'-deoxyadenosine deaminase [Myxococcales bacterium]
MGTVLRGGTVVTMDASRRVVHGDVRIDGDRIVGVGAIEAEAGDTIVDASGAAVIPGLVQAHVHLCQALFRGMADDLPLLAWLKERIWPFEAAHTPESLRASAELGLAEMLLGGTTTILDMGTVHHQDAVFEAILVSGMRARSGKAMMDVGDDVPAGLRESRAASVAESVRLRDRWDGAAGGRLGYAFAPRFILSCSEGLLRDVAAAAAEGKNLVHTHVAEHADERAAVRQVLGRDDLEALEAYGIAGPRAVMAHGVQLTAEEMRRVAERGTRIVHCPSANLKLASGIADVRALREAGVVVALGADGAPCNNRMDAWTELREAALLAKVKSESAAAIPAREAFELITVDGARALGLENEIGSIEVGKRADVVVVGLDALHQWPGGAVPGNGGLGGDVYSTLVYATTPADVRSVFVDGRCVVDRGELRSLDVEAVRAAARLEAERLLGRVAA